MKRRAIRIGLWSAAVLLLASRPSAAQDPIDRLLGQPITAVELQVEGRPETSAPLLALVDIKPGEPFTVETYRRVADRLNQVPRFEGVTVKADERPSGLVLIFILEPRHPIDRLEFPGGDTGLAEPTLQRLVRERFSGLPAFTRKNDVEETVRRILEEEGYRRAAVTSDITLLHDPDRATLNVHIQAGPLTKIRSIKVVGESPFSEQEVLKKLGIAVGEPFRDRALLASLAGLRDDLRSGGYYTATADSEPVIDGADVDLVLTVNSGPLVRLIIKGELPGSEDVFIPIKRQGSADEDLLFDSRLATERELKRQGYRHAAVKYESADSADLRIITFTIDRGKRFRIVRVELPAGLHITPAEIHGIAALKVDSWFNEEAVARAMLALAAIYQQDGYHSVKLDPKYEEVAGRSDDEGGIVVIPNIVEGPQAFVTRVTFELGDRPTITESALRGIMRSQERTPPAPYSPANLVYDRQAVPSYYESQGFLNQQVAIGLEFNAAETEVVLHVKATEGERVVVGDITIVGNERNSRESILREITLHEGEPYSDAARIESQRRLYNTNGYRSVLVTAQPRLPGETKTRIVISVVETGSVTVGFGGGVEGASRARNVEGGGVEDRLEFSPRTSIDVTRRNLGGRNRQVNFFGRVALKPRNSEDPALDGKGFGFTEYRVNVTFQERYFRRTDADLLMGISSEQAVRSTFSYVKHSATTDLAHPLPKGMTLSTRYSLEYTRLFDERLSEEDQSLIDRLFPQVRLSILSGTVFRDRRDSQATPAHGSLVTAGLDYGPRWLGSEVGFIKSSISGSFYRPVLDRRRIIFAGRVLLGLARGFERSVDRVDDAGQPVLDENGKQIQDVVADVPASQRFFSGGSNTVRGFQLDRLGVPEILNENGLSNGGNGMLVFNAELRMATGQLFGRNLTTVAFVDAGNVFARAGDIDLSRLRPAAGFGFRYDSPLGPLRFDTGFKLDHYTFANAKERRWEIHLSLFEVF